MHVERRNWKKKSVYLEKLYNVAELESMFSHVKYFHNCCFISNWRAL